MTTRRVHFLLETQVLEQAKQAAKADRRTLANWLAVTVERVLADEPSEPAEKPAPRP